jgi:DNA polymerase I-like protein with 3'-5' exonuclease and polymerase domains
MGRLLIIEGEGEYEWSWWSGEKLTSSEDSPIAYDTETELIRTIGNNNITDPRHVPTPSLGMAYDGTRLVAIHPSKMGAFFTAHRGCRFVGHNFAFDFWTTYNILDRGGKEILWQIGDRNGYSDTMILDMLLQLGKGRYRKGGNNASEDSKLYPTDLGTLSAEAGGLLLRKDSPYRLRFGEWIGLSESQIDSYPDSAGFFDYALADAIATYRVYKKQRAEAVELMMKCGWKRVQTSKTYEIRPDALDKFGPLSEYIQVKASIALAELSRTPIEIDQEKRKEIERAARERYQTAIDHLTAEVPDLIKYTKAKYKVEKTKDVETGKVVKTKRLIKEAEVKYTAKASIPQMNNKVLAEKLQLIAAELEVPVPISKGKKKEISLSSKAWSGYADRSPFIQKWVTLEQEAKLLEFLTAIDAKEVYSRYNLLMRTGRTSAGAYRYNKELLLPSINIQQMPREDSKRPEKNVRSLFRPPKGYKWYSCDYSYLELRSLAAACKALFGWSKLAEIIVEHTTKGGIDPHQRTAAVILNMTVNGFLSLPKDEQKQWRQAAKAVNFGRPGGLGDAKFLEYAKTSYGVTFTLKEAKEAKKKWLALYPEIKLYLGDRTTQAMEWRCGRKIQPLSWIQKKRISDFIRGEEKDREKFKETELVAIWNLLETLAYATKDEEIIEDVEKRKVTARIKSLLTYRACTLTGRVRDRVKYTDGCNTPFQGVAADGCKLAAWKLVRRGFKVMAFIHDAFDVAVPIQQAGMQAKQVDKIMIESMEEILGQGVPVAVEGILNDCWSKA